VATKVEVPLWIMPVPESRVGTKARTCYSCKTSYSDSDFFRFCPRDGVDLEYAPPRIDDLGRDLGTAGRKWKWIGVLSLLVPLLIFSAMYLNQFVSATAGSAQSGELVVKTTPSGAVVYLDGSQVGVTPVRLSDIPTGYHSIRAVFPGYKSGMARVEILPSSSQRLVLEMVPMSETSKDFYIAANISPAEVPGGTDHNP